MRCGRTPDPGQSLTDAAMDNIVVHGGDTEQIFFCWLQYFLLRRVGGRVEAAGLVRPRDLGLRQPRGRGPGGLVEVGARPLCNHRQIQTRPHPVS